MLTATDKKPRWHSGDGGNRPMHFYDFCGSWSVAVTLCTNSNSFYISVNIIAYKNFIPRMLQMDSYWYYKWPHNTIIAGLTFLQLMYPDYWIVLFYSMYRHYFYVTLFTLGQSTPCILLRFVNCQINGSSSSSSSSRMNVWVAGKTVWSLVNTCHSWAL